MGCDTDVFIVEEDPLGAAAIAAERGFRVIVADGAKPPITKACGEGLLPDALKALDELGVALREEDGRVLRGIQFEDGRSSVSANFPDGHGLGVRREVLHQRIMERARDCGVELLWNTTVMGLHKEGVIAGGNKILARWVIGADEAARECGDGAGWKAMFRNEIDLAFDSTIDGAWTDLQFTGASCAGMLLLERTRICAVLISNKPNLRF
jgi:flavin-dependent dehydrogenase